MRFIFLSLIRFYQFAISPLLGNRCRFFPSCSEYGKQAVQIHGAWKGVGLTIVRLAKCGPWHRGGCDPVPEKKTTTRE